MYNIRKGWPADSAIDEAVSAATGQTIVDGQIVTVANGQISLANFTAAAAATDGIPGFVIGKENVRNKYTVILSQCVIEIDSDHFATGTYTAGTRLTAANGKFSPVTATGEKAVGRVLAYDATNSKMRVLFFAAA